jgi:polar amino acid transport system permease protein
VAQVNKSRIKILFPKEKIEVSDGMLIPGKGDKTLFSAWRIAFFGAILILIALPLSWPPFLKFLNHNPAPYREVLEFIPDGILITFEVTVLSIIFAVAVGLLIGVARISRNSFINKSATVYVEIIRGIPLLVQLFYIYFALAKFVKVPDITAAVIGMSVCYGAYISEIFRGGILSIPKGQMEAALALGMSRSQAIRKVIIPQTFKVILPPLGNEFIALLKDSSLVSILAVADLLRRGREYASVSFNYFEAYTIVALVYLILTLFLSRLVGIMEERMKRNVR